MANTIGLNNHQSLIWQDEGDSCDAILVTPEAQGNMTWLTLNQRENIVVLNLAGAKELIKQLQWFVKNQDTVIKECK